MQVKMSPEGKFSSVTMSEGEYRALGNDSGGMCVACGEEAYGIEPDARRYPCESCDKRAVYGIEELLMMGRVKIGE